VCWHELLNLWKAAMKILIHSLCALALFGFTSVAQAKVSWQGEVMVTAVSGAACAANKDAVGDNYLADFEPSGVTGNSANSFLSFLSRRSAFALKVAGSIKPTSPATTKAYTGVFVSGRGEFSTGPTGSFSGVTITPASIAATTDVVSIVATIANWQSDVGCTATIHGAFVLRRN
jgi:hypothetical protein